MSIVKEICHKGTKNIFVKDGCVEGLDIHSEKETFSIAELIKDFDLVSCFWRTFAGRKLGVQLSHQGTQRCFLSGTYTLKQLVYADYQAKSKPPQSGENQVVRWWW